MDMSRTLITAAIIRIVMTIHNIEILDASFFSIPDLTNNLRATKKEKMFIIRKAAKVLAEIADMLLESISYSLK